MYLGPTGLACSVGQDAAAACAAIRAGISGFTELPFHSPSRQPIVAAPVPGLDLRGPRATRLFELATRAITNVLADSPDVRPAAIPLIVGMAEPNRPGGADAAYAKLLNEVQGRLGVTFHPSQSRVMAKGHTAGFEALRAARELLATAAVPACLVCSVDSFINPVTLTWLSDTWRLKHEGHSNGLIPGEAGAAVLVTARPRPGGPAVRVAGLGFAREEAAILSDRPLLGTGLIAAARDALAEAKCQMRDIKLRLADLTGEAYGFKEQALSMSRLMREGPSELPVWHPAEAIGETGAAAGVVLLAIARHAFLGSYAPGPRALCYTCSIPGDRAAAVLERLAE